MVKDINNYGKLEIVYKLLEKLDQVIRRQYRIIKWIHSILHIKDIIR